MLPKIHNISKKASNESFSKLNFVQEVWERYVLPPPPAELWLLKDWYGWNIILYWNCKLHSFRAERYQKYTLFERKLQMKVVENWICTRSLRACMFLSPRPPQVELWPSEDWCGWNIILYWKRKLHSFSVESCQKYAVFQRKLEMKVL